MGGLVWLALDGVGHPLDAPPDSPWAVREEGDLPFLRALVDGGAALDARLGVEGLPQSATGQTTWLTGVNAAQLMGHHYGPRPGPTLRPLLARGLPARLRAAGGRAELLNFFPPGYFERTRLGHGCFPLSVLAAGSSLNPEGFPLVPPTLGLNFQEPWSPTPNAPDPRRLGAQIADAATGADLLILDLWFSDFLGHEGRPDPPPDLPAAARGYLERLDALLEGLLDGGARVAITSDHGNFEDLHTKMHTLARVPFALSGLPRPPVADIAEGGRALAAVLGLPSDPPHPPAGAAL